VPGLVKTRLIPALGAERAATLQDRLTRHTVATAMSAAVGPVTLWATPDEHHPTFQALAADFGVTLARQSDGDLGARMLAPMTVAPSPCLVIGTDCPALTAGHLQDAAEILRGGSDAVLIPVVDGGYVLIGTRRPQPALFTGVAWSTSSVTEETRRRLRRENLTWRELATLWDIDRPEDLIRLRAAGLGDLVPVER
jgi:rSAM/selenodomain-associated transferase 1